MKTFKEYIKEHPNLRTRVVKAINPMEKIRDKMADLKKRGGLTGIAKTKLKKELDKINPLSPINKMKTKSTKEKIKKLSAKKKGLDTTSAGLGLKIKDLRKQIEPK